MKIALCFIISYNHILNKEDIWQKWIEHNKDIINVYFFYKDLQKIKSSWILKHVVDPSFIKETTYYHVVPAYLSVLSYAFQNLNNQWFCLLTESCCPIISPKKFRSLFYRNYNLSIMNWRKAWWNVDLQKRANLFQLPEKFHLANDPYFILKREDVSYCFQFTHKYHSLYKLICDGGLANESLFVIIMFIYKRLDKFKKKVTHLTDWSRMTSPTSPYLFINGTDKDKMFIENGLKDHPCAIFIRKISPDFPDNILIDFIYNKTNINVEISSYTSTITFFTIILFIHCFLFYCLYDNFSEKMGFLCFLF